MRTETGGTVERDHSRVASLVLRAQAGDNSAYSELIRGFAPTIYALSLRRVRNPQKAEELAQDAIVRGWRKIGQLRDPQRFAGWIKMIVWSVAGRRQRYQPSSGEDWLLSEVADKAETEAVEADIAEEAEVLRRSQLSEAVERLSELDRQTLEAYYFRGRSVMQMSRDFGAPLGTVKRRMHDARRRLGRVVEQHYPELAVTGR